VKRTISLHPFVDLIFKEVWRAGIGMGWPRPSYSLAVEACMMTGYYHIVLSHCSPSKEALDSALKFVAGKVKTTEKDEQRLHEYIQGFVESQKVQKAVASFLAQNRDAGGS
jgi:hypothetical protein